MNFIKSIFCLILVYGCGASSGAHENVSNNDSGNIYPEDIPVISVSTPSNKVDSSAQQVSTTNTTQVSETKTDKIESIIQSFPNNQTVCKQNNINTNVCLDKCSYLFDKNDYNTITKTNICLFKCLGYAELATLNVLMSCNSGTCIL